MKLLRECSQQARSVNQSMLVALSEITNIPYLLIWGCSGFAGRRMGTKYPGTTFFSIYFPQKYDIYDDYIPLRTLLVMASSKNS